MVILMLLIMAVTYGVNFFLFRYLNKRPKIDVVGHDHIHIGIAARNKNDWYFGSFADFLTPIVAIKNRQVDIQ